MNTIGKIIVIAVVILGTTLLFSFPVMWLWNWLMPELFSLSTIDIWHAMGILLLCRALFTNGIASSSKN